MNTTRGVRRGLALLLLAAAAAWADPPVEGRVVVLTNEEVLTGRVVPTATGYRLLGSAGETVLPARQVLKVCADLETAYAFVRTRANLNDADERLRMARWCWKQQLDAHGREEAEAALRLRPGDEEAQRWLRAFQARAQAAQAPASPAPAAPASAPLAPVAEGSYKPEQLQEYTRQIQPILVNTCATGACHGQPGRTFVVARPADGGLVTPALTRQNLARVLAQVNRADPTASPLLTRALEAHGGLKRPPLPGPANPAYQILEKWVLRQAPTKPNPLDALDKDQQAATAEGPAGFATERDGAPATPPPPAPERPRDQEPPRPPPAGGFASAGRAPDGAAPLSRDDAQPQPPPTDPFDPEIFNRRYK